MCGCGSALGYLYYVKCMPFWKGCGLGEGGRGDIRLLHFH